MAPLGRRGPVVPLRSIAVGSIIRRDGGGSARKNAAANAAKSAKTCTTTDSSFEVTPQKDISFSVGSTVSADSFGLPVDALSFSDDTEVEQFREGVQRPGSLRRPRQFRNFRDELEYMNLDNDAVFGKNPGALLESNHEDDEEEEGAGGQQHDSPKMPSPPCSPFSSMEENPIMSVEVSASGFLRGDDLVSFLDENDENEVQQRPQPSTVRPSQHQRCKQERRYWSALVSSRMKVCGQVHLKTVDGLMNLGNAQLQCREYNDSLTTFKVALRIQRKLLGNTDRHVAIARILDRIGLAACKASAKSQEELHTARTALHQAFLLRYELLGAWHVDTVESLNNLARVQMLLHHYHEARKSYYEVLRVRKAIFGADHPSVAVTAHSLAKACTKLNQLDEAYTYFQMAVEIYERMDMPKENPTYASLMQDVNRLERVLHGMSSRSA